MSIAKNDALGASNVSGASIMLLLIQPFRVVILVIIVICRSFECVVIHLTSFK